MNKKRCIAISVVIISTNSFTSITIRTRVKVSPEVGGGAQEQAECRQNKAQLINSLQVVNKKTGYHDDDYNDEDDVNTTQL